MDAPHAGRETEMLAEREATKRGLIGRVCFWRHGSGVQYVAHVTHAWSPECVNLLVLGDYGVDLGNGPGMPSPRLSVPRGQGHECWQAELDP